jgi:hypothetical protein
MELGGRAMFRVAVAVAVMTTLIPVHESVRASDGKEAWGASPEDYSVFDAKMANPEAATLQSSTNGIQIFIDRQLDEGNYRAVVNSAARKFVSVARDDDVLDCTFGAPRRNTPDRWAFRGQLDDRLRTGQQIHILTFAWAIPHNRAGWPVAATVGLGLVGYPQSRVAVNSTAFPRIWDHVDSFALRANEVAGVIAHEVAHTLGYSHPVDADGNQSFNDFVYIYGDCIQQILDERE